MSQSKSRRNSAKNPEPPLSSRKLWYFRLMALLGLPVVLLGLLDLGLRVADFGYPTRFLLNSSNHGVNTFVQNDQFGWRFFGARAARLPDAISISRERSPNTFRIFVFGESAAYGDPQPRFGLSRMLEALLELRHPEKKFEVVNAAMTGINSHVILPLARDCEDAHADVWVIYMGNNEVVGPFGAGTVFGSQTLALPLIRAGLELKATKIGQLFDALRGAADQKRSVDSGEWEGMRAFVKYKLAESDPRLRAVYDNFAKNLGAIIAAGQNSGAKIVLSTVGVNLEDCAPFASLHRPGLSASQLTDWQRFFRAGVKSQTAEDFRRAATNYDQAERIDGSFAELRFRRAQCALALDDAALAKQEFSAARDLDALRFRCDGQLNDIIRRQAVNGVTLADGESALAQASPDGIPGADCFYEHVHLTFRGNYVLARAIAEQVEKVLSLAPGAIWPGIDQCAQRLAYTPRDTQLALSDIFGRMSDPPFTFQANHGDQMRRVIEAESHLPPPNSTLALNSAQSAAEAALARWSNDAVLWEQLGEIKQQRGDDSGARAAVERSLDLLPSSIGSWQLEGILLAQAAKYQDAVTAFKHVLALDPQAVWAWHNLALCLEKQGRTNKAIAAFKRALALKPDYGTAWLALGQLYEGMGNTNEARHCYTEALTHRVNQADDLATLARFCFSRGWYGPAITNFAAAIELCPTDAGLRMDAGRALAALGRHADAAREFFSAVQLEPDQAQPHMQLGVELGMLRQPALAEQEFRQVLRLDPEFTGARADLGIALYEQKKLEDARRQFEEVLRLSPHDATALRFTQLLRNHTSPPAGQ